MNCVAAPGLSSLPIWSECVVGEAARPFNLITLPRNPAHARRKMSLLKQKFDCWGG